MQNVKDIIVAIDSVKSRAKQAKLEGDLETFERLINDLLALENCLVTEIKKELKIA